MSKKTPRQRALDLRKKYRPRITKAKQLRDKYAREAQRLENEMNDKILRLFS